MNSRSPAEEAPIVTTTTLRLFIFPPVSNSESAAGTTPTPLPTPVAAAPVEALARATAPVNPPSRTGAEDPAFSDEILDWMSRGDSLAEPRTAEAVDLGLDEPRRTPPPGMRSRRAATRERRLRRVLTVGALAFAGWAVVLWSTRHSVTVGDRAALAATSETSAAPPAASARALRPIDPNAPGAAFAAPAVPAPAPAPAVVPTPLAEKSSSARSQARQRPGAAGAAPAGATKPQRHRRGRR